MSRKNTTQSICVRQTGFTLVESMAAVLILSIGVLGILQFLTGSIKANSLNNPRAVAINTAGEELVKLYKAGAEGQDALRTQLTALASGATITGKTKYTVTAVAAQDSLGIGLITQNKDGTFKVNASPANWSSPISVGVKISYSVNGETLVVHVPQTVVF